MARKKGSKNKKINKREEKKEVITDIPVHAKKPAADIEKVKEEIPAPEVVDEATDEETSEPEEEEPAKASIFKRKNPLIGYPLDEVKMFVNEINPPCGRGGCLHLKEFHIKNIKGKLECHLCNCADFIG